MKKYILYISYWVIASLVIYLSSLISKDNVVLIGTNIPAVFSAIKAGFIVTLLTLMTLLFIEARGTKISEIADYLIFFFIADAISIWITARFSDYFGFGIRNYRYAIILALSMVVFQRLSFHYYKKMESKG